jgi:hypothetical protein
VKQIGLAYALLREKGHAIGRSFSRDASPSGAFSGGEPNIETEVDGLPRTQEQIIEIAAEYPEWKDRGLAALRAAIDEGDASGIAEGNVFARVQETLGPPPTSGTDS